MAKSKDQKITIKVSEENPEPLELIAKSIVDIAEAIEKINNSKLSRRTVVLILQDATGITQREINMILDLAPKLRSTYLKK